MKEGIVMNLFLAAAGGPYDVMFLLSVMILAGMFIGRFTEKFNIPNITGYIFVGLIVGAGLVLTDRINLLDAFTVMTSIALGFISFSIGLELSFKKIARRRNEVIIVTIVQALAAFLFTAVGLWIFNLPLHIALVLGAIAIATEPGPILLITKKYRTKGALTDTLVPLHGVEDAFAIIIFGVVLSYAVAVNNNVSMTFMDILEGPIYELLFSVVIAFTIGVVFTQIIKRLDYDDAEKDLVVFVTAFVAILMSIAIANRGFEFLGAHVHLSPVLLPMGVGITFANLSSRTAKHETEHVIDQFSPPIMIAFFTMVGAEIVILIATESADIGYIAILIASAVYIAFRTAGKIWGSWFGAKLAKSDKAIQKYLGFCLIPQAQAAIGLAFYARTQLGHTYYGNLLLMVVLVGTVFYEFVGPMAVKRSLVQCNETDDSGNCVVKDLK